MLQVCPPYLEDKGSQKNNPVKPGLMHMMPLVCLFLMIYRTYVGALGTNGGHHHHALSALERD